MSINAAELIILTKAVGALDAQLALEAVGVAVVAAGVASVKMAGDFQASVTKLYTTAGETQSNLKMVGDGMLNMAASVGTSALKLGDAMYWIESGGLHGKVALEALRVAAQAAKAENANLDKVSIALAASLNAYAGSGMSAVQVMNTLTAATGQGMMTFEQLSGSLASVLPAAAKFGISLNNVTAALATMTAQGDPAEQAATHLKQVILALEAPSRIGASALKSVGLTSAEVATEMRKNLPDALAMITDAVGKKFPEGSSAYNQAVKNIAGGSKQMMGFLELTGSHMSTFADNVGKISAAVSKGGNDLMGWADIQKNFNFQLDAMNAAVGVLMIRLGSALLPALSQVFSLVTPLIGAFGDWLGKTNVLSNASQSLSNVLGAIGDAFRFVFAPLEKVQQSMKPLIDTFDRASGILKPMPGLLKPLNDGFDRASAVIKPVAAALNPMADSLDRATGLIKANTGAVAFTPNVWIPFWEAIKKVADQIKLVDWGSIGTGLAKATVAISQLDWGAVGNAIVTVVGFIQQMIATGVSVVNFFRQNELAATALGVAIGALGGILALFAAASVADMILSLLDYGASMLAAVAETVTGAAIMTTTFTDMAALIVGSMGASSVAILSTLGPFLLVGAVVAAVGIGIVLAIQHWGEISQWFSGVWAATVSDFNRVIGGIKTALQAAAQWFNDWKTPILIVAGAITLFFLPALIAAGTQATISGGKIALDFIGSMALAGIAATNNALLITADFITSMIETGTAAVLNGAKVTLSFIASMWAAGSAAVVNAAKITYSFIASLIAVGIQGWVAAGGLIPFVTGLIASGVQGAIAAAGMMTTLVPSLRAVGAAAYASMGPIGLILGGIALIVTALELMKQKSDEWKTGTTGDFNSAGDMIQRSTGRIIKTADQMKVKVSNDVYTMDSSVSSSMDDMQKKAAQDMETMRRNTISKGAQASTGLQNLFDTMLSQVGGDFSQMSSDAYSYLADVESYVTQAQAKILSARIGRGGINIVNKNFGGYAEGTNYAPGGISVVGEKGPEIMYIPRGAQIIPNNQINSMGGGGLSSGGQQTIIVNPPPVYLDGRLLTRGLMPHFVTQVRGGTGVKF